VLLFFGFLLLIVYLWVPQARPPIPKNMQILFIVILLAAGILMSPAVTVPEPKPVEIVEEVKFEVVGSVSGEDPNYAEQVKYDQLTKTFRLEVLINKTAEVIKQADGGTWVDPVVNFSITPTVEDVGLVEAEQVAYAECTASAPTFYKAGKEYRIIAIDEAGNQRLEWIKPGDISYGTKVVPVKIAETRIAQLKIVLDSTGICQLSKYEVKSFTATIDGNSFTFDILVVDVET
jgi:hypothetical protein